MSAPELEIKSITPEEEALLKKNFAVPRPHVRVGSNGCFLPASYAQHANAIRNAPLREGDIFVVTFPRSGTTWTQELVWLITNDLDYETAKKILLTDRYLFVEISSFMDEEAKRMMGDVPGLELPPAEALAALKSPRYVKSHLPLSLLPDKLLDGTRTVYVARDPRDVVVSYYHFTKGNKLFQMVCDFDGYFDMYLKDMALWAPFFAHIKEAWQQRHNPNMLFLFYEDLIKDLVGTSRRVAEFFGRQYSEEQLKELAKHLHFDSFSKNQAVDLKMFKDIGVFDKDMTFVRKGKAGAWRETLSPAQVQRANAWMKRLLSDTDLRFPDC